MQMSSSSPQKASWAANTHKKAKVLNQNGTIMDFLFPKKVLHCFGAAYKKYHTKKQSKS